jgi:hypothetical protein
VLQVTHLGADRGLAELGGLDVEIGAACRQDAGLPSGFCRRTRRWRPTGAPPAPVGLGLTRKQGLGKKTPLLDSAIWSISTNFTG